MAIEHNSVAADESVADLMDKLSAMSQRTSVMTLDALVNAVSGDKGTLLDRATVAQALATRITKSVTDLQNTSKLA